jgi:UDP-3-O-[3-hydroxymyristoyl] glucosamine N-acyltransferase
VKKTSERARTRSGSRRKTAGPDLHEFTLAQVAAAVGGSVLGDSSLRLTGVETLDRAASTDLSWVSDRRRARQAADSRAGALLVSSEEDAVGKPAVLVPSPKLALAIWLELSFPGARPQAGISKGAHVSGSARLRRGVSVAAGATVEAGARVGARTVLCAGAFVGREAVVGDDCYLHPGAAVLERCRIGARCVLQAGAVIGSDGFGYVWDGQRHRKIPQLGIVRIEDDVEIGANAAIDRATLGETVVERGTKIDNLVQVGHNVVVGEHSILCGQAGIAGSARLGRGVTLAGQVGVNDHITIGDRTVATGQAGVTGNLPAGGIFSGMPAAPHREFLKRAALIARLPELARRVDEIERRVAGPRKGGKPWKSESRKS